MLGGIGCFVMAVLVDFVEGLDEEQRFNPYRWIADRVDFADYARRRVHETEFDAVRHFSKDTEEVLEMFGNTLLWIALLRHWLASVASIRIRLPRE